MEDNWADKTSVGFVIQRKANDDSIRVFHVKTQSSTYVLGFFGCGGPRPFAMMRGMSQGMGHEIDLRDSSPRIGEKLLFEVPPSQWIGERIDMAGTKTSPVASATEETNPVHTDTLIRTLMQPTPRATASDVQRQAEQREREERSRARRRETPYPESYIEYVESLAAVLRNMASSATVDDIGRQVHLVARLKVALMNARVASDDIVRRLG